MAANSSARRLHPKNIEKRRRCPHAAQLHWLIHTGQRHGAPGQPSHGRENPVLILPIEKVEGGDSVALTLRGLLPHVDDFFGMWVGQRSQEYCINEAENRRVRTDPQCQRGDRYHRKARALKQHASAVT
jgi:hypothetical protein